MQAVLDFPFQAARAGLRGATRRRPTRCGRSSRTTTGTPTPTRTSTSCRRSSGTTTWGGSAASSSAANAGASDAELLARDRLAHELMYFSRGNPVVYYGDEQGFTGDGGDQLARQDMFPSRVARVQRRRPDRHRRARRRVDNFEPGAPAVPVDRAASRRSTRAAGAARRRAAAPATSAPGAGVYAFSRIDRREQREYVVALNNAETAKTAAIPTYTERRRFERALRRRPRAGARATRAGRLTLTVPALSAVVYKLDGRIAASQPRAVDRAAPAGAGERCARPHGGPRGRRRRLVLRGHVPRRGTGRGWTPIGTDDNAPYRVFHDVSALRAGHAVQYKASCSTTAGTRARARRARATVPPPAVTLRRRACGPRRATARCAAVADPERATHVGPFERSVAGGAVDARSAATTRRRPTRDRRRRRARARARSHATARC